MNDPGCHQLRYKGSSVSAGNKMWSYITFRLSRKRLLDQLGRKAVSG